VELLLRNKCAKICANHVFLFLSQLQVESQLDIVVQLQVKL
jgi:hypothetical protein